LKCWFDVLPPQVQECSPWMALWRGVSLSPFAAAAGAGGVRERRTRASAKGATIGRILSIGAILTTHYLEFDHGQVDRWIDLLLPELEPRPTSPRRVRKCG
jgi:hypothetical protein